MVAKICSWFLFNIVKICPLYLSKVKKRLSNLQIPVNHIGNDRVPRHLLLDLLFFFLLICTLRTSLLLVSLGTERTHIHCLYSAIIICRVQAAAMGTVTISFLLSESLKSLSWRVSPVGTLSLISYSSWPTK